MAYMNQEDIYNAGGSGVGVHSQKQNTVNEIQQMAAKRKAENEARIYEQKLQTALADQQAANAKQQQAAADNAYARFLANMEAQQAALAQQKAAEQAARKEQYNLSKSNVNTAADDALRQAYIRKRQQMQQMPQQNALLGNGGLSETAMLQMEADYGNNRANLEGERIAQLANLETQLNEGLAIDESNYYQKLQNLQQQQADAELQRDLSLAQIAEKANSTPTYSASQAKDILSVNPNHTGAAAAYRDYYGVDYMDDNERILNNANKSTIVGLDYLLKQNGYNKDSDVISQYAAKLVRDGLLDEKTYNAWYASR